VIPSRELIPGFGPDRYFWDSADVADKPVIFYTMEGALNPVTGAVALKKSYEQTRETEGYDLDYQVMWPPAERGTQISLWTK
jgi:hypothetical protein